MSQSERSQAVKMARTAAAAAVLALLAVTCQGRAIALEAGPVHSSSETSSSGAPTPIYFGNGCFWGRQKDYIDAEKAMGRPKTDLSAVVGYAGGQKKGESQRHAVFPHPKRSFDVASDSLRLCIGMCTLTCSGQSCTSSLSNW